MITSLLLFVNIYKMATKKRSWESKEPKCSKKCKEVCDERVCCKNESVVNTWEKILISKESLEDWRITRNELIMQVTEQQNIIDDLYEDVVELAVDLDDARFVRNISIAINIVLVVLLFIVA